MIQVSPEIAAIARRLMGAIVEGEAATLRNLISDDANVTMVGSAEDEYWEGAAVREGFAQHFSEAPISASEEIDTQGYQDGTIGWAISRRKFFFHGTDIPVTIRATLIFRLELGNWKLVHRHGSVGRPNIDLHGANHKVLNSLIEAARDGFRLDQREGLASVMFTDIANSSAIAEMQGDRVWATLVSDHFDQVGAVITAQGGQLVKSLGDGTMSSFPSARAALAAAIEIQRQNAAVASEPALALRIGIHTGDVIQAKDDFFGSVVNKAARIAALAAPDDIRVSDATRIMAGATRGFAFADPVSVALKGLDGEHLIHRLEWRE